MTSNTNNRSEDREYWVATLDRIASPVLLNLAEGNLRAVMPFECAAHCEEASRKTTHLQAFGRTLAGIAPWLILKGGTWSECALREKFFDAVVLGIDHATNPESPDFMGFDQTQNLVDAAFLAQGILRSRGELWARLSQTTRHHLVSSLKRTRKISPCFNNWLLFSAIIEVCLRELGEDWDAMRVDFAVRQHMQWYKGDGAYGDGVEFHWDYYNGYVIHPMLVDIVLHGTSRLDEMKETILERATRYALVQERLIAPDGSFPPLGRSITYRFGAFQALGQMALLELLPSSIAIAQIRCAMGAVIAKCMEMPGTLDEGGWLRIGLCGSQPSLGESYISTGSLYLCLCGLLPLGLSDDHAFWTDPAEEWSSLRVWSGRDAVADYSYSERKE